MCGSQYNDVYAPQIQSYFADKKDGLFIRISLMGGSAGVSCTRIEHSVDLNEVTSLLINFCPGTEDVISELHSSRTNLA